MRLFSLKSESVELSYPGPFWLIRAFITRAIKLLDVWIPQSFFRGVFSDNQPTSLETGECHMVTQKDSIPSNGRLEIQNAVLHLKITQNFAIWISIFQNLIDPIFF